jgi:type II secretory pathway predicted ATPase ExeA
MTITDGSLDTTIVNGRLDDQQELLHTLNLAVNPFVRTKSNEAPVGQVFVGRVNEIRAAAMRVVDHARNLLVWGGHGCGKTTFLRKLLHELRAARKISFLTGYTTLVEDTPQGFQRAALSAFCKGARGVASSDALSTFAVETLRALTSGAEIGAIDLRFEQGLELARGAGFHRVVIAIDELEKYEADVVQRMLLSSRFLLDLDASFVLTGRPLDILSDSRAALLAVYDHRIELKPFADAEAREILRRNLTSARHTPEPEETLRPFEDEAVAEMVVRARGLPRPLNLMAGAALQLALDEAALSGAPVASVTAAHLARALEREGHIIYEGIGPEGRSMVGHLYQHGGFASSPYLEALAPGRRPHTLHELEELTQEDAVLNFEAVDGAAFLVSPLVEQSLRVQRGKRVQLRALWKNAIEAPDKDARGKALEDFAAAFFGEVFVIKERNLRTDTEELDLVLEHSPATDPRFKNAAYLIVECKNWRTRPVDQTAITKLYGELSLHHLKQGFLLATSTFTRKAAQQARYAFSEGVEIMLIEGVGMADFLDGLSPVGDFLADLHRRQILRAM